MQLILRPRGAGKTHECVKALIADPASIMIVADMHRVEAVAHEPQPGKWADRWVISRVFTARQLRDGEVERYIGPHPARTRVVAHIDDLELVLGVLLGPALQVGTVSAQSAWKNLGLVE